MSSRNPVHARRANAARQGKRVISFIVAIVLLTSGTFYGLISTRSKISDDTLCPADEASPRVTVILVDAPPIVEGAVNAHVRTVLSSPSTSFLAGERILLYSTTSSGLESKPRFDKCKPRDGGDANSLYENDRRLRDRFASTFEKPFNEAMEAMSRRAPTEDGSFDAPLIELLSKVSASAHQFFGNEAAQRRLIIISPFLQKSAGLTHSERCDPSFADYSRGQFSASHPLELGGISVVAYQMPVEADYRALQRESVRSFWESLLHTRILGPAVSNQSIEPLPRCAYPTLEDEARRHAVLAIDEMRHCNYRSSAEYLTKAKLYSEVVASAQDVQSKIRSYRARCEEEARRRRELEELARAAKAAEQASSAVRKTD